MLWHLLLTITLIPDLIQLGANPQVVEQQDNYERIALTDSTSLEVYKGDSITVVFTVCAPQCSSRVRVYNKEWQLIRDVEPPFSSIFPLATIDREQGIVVWKDNNIWNYQSTL